MNKRVATLLLIALLAVSFLAAYFTTFRGLVSIWANDEDYSYGFLIPMVTAYLIWENRRKLSSSSVYTSWLGAPPFAVLMLISTYGILGSSPSAVRPAIPLVIASIILFCYGPQLLRALLFPVLFLFFMVPLPTVVQNTIGVPLKLISTKLGAVVLHLFGISVFVQGNVIDLGVTQLQVVDACGGLRFILPLLALGAIFAHFFEKTRWKQVVLVLVTIPISVVTNGVRIGATGILAQKYGSQVAEGFFHGFSGWIVFMFAFSLLFGIFFLLRILFPRATQQSHSDDQTELANKAVPSEQIAHRQNWPAIVICSASMLILAALSFSTSALPRLSIQGGLVGFPMVMNDWTGQKEEMDPEIIALSGAEEALSVRYSKDHGPSVSFYVGYRGSPFNESTNFFHSPSICLPSSGWKVISSGNHKITQIPGFGSIVASKMVIEQMESRQVVYYWFQTKSRASYDVNINRFHLALHAIKRDNTYDLFIRPITPVYPGEGVRDAEKRMDDFVGQMMPTLLQFIKERQYEQK
jgi:exosortase D (VPLPA-CTERM-specific)